MTTKDAVENEREQWKDVSKRLDFLFALSSDNPPNMEKLKDGINALSSASRKYTAALKARVEAEAS